MPDSSQADIAKPRLLSVTTTVGSMEDATRLARALVDARLAACVQVEPIAASVYRWEGRLCETPEVRLTRKTVPARAEALEAFFARHHPYELPQFVAMPCAGSPAYAAWVAGEVA